MGEIIKSKAKKQEIKFTMHKTDRLLTRNRLVIHYNNIANPFMTLYLYKNDKLVINETYMFDEHEIINGLPVNINKVADIIREYVTKIDNIQLAISSDDTFKTTISLPKISKRKAKKLYKEEAKNNNGDFKDSYMPFYEYYTHSLGYIFYTYFIPVNIVNTFVKIAALLKTKLTKVDLFSHFLFNNIYSKINDDFILHYNEFGISTFVLSYNHSFSAGISFRTNENKMNLYYVSSIVKHSFELEKKEINTIFSNNVNCLKQLNDVKEIDVSFDTYNFKGIDL